MDINKTYNIHHMMADELWDRLLEVYEQLPGWQGEGEDGCYCWFGEEGKGIEYLSVYIEPSGLCVDAVLNEVDWKAWDRQFRQLATEALGYQIMDAEEGRAWDFMERREGTGRKISP